jgi:glyoxylase-like metal-dependent hydrolase (beta-lactamase superfamily II)
MGPSAWLVEYGHVDTHPVAGFVADATGARGTPFCFAAVKDGTAVTLVDVGFSAPYHQQRLSAKYGGGRWVSPVDALARIGIPAAEVGQIVLTHKHFDHAAAVADFPAAEVLIQQAEIERHRAALREPERLAAELRATDPGVLDVLGRCRLRLLSGGATVGPLTVAPALDTHTAGSQYAVLGTADGPLVFAGDNVSAYENVEGDAGRPGPIPVGSLNGPVANWMALADALVAAAAGDTSRIIPFHDDEAWHRYPTVAFPDGLRVAALTCATPLPTEDPE